jgi:uncharacterized protein (TIGR03067 family)
MRRSRSLLPAAGLLALLTAASLAPPSPADDKEDAGRKELKKLEGTWQMVAGEHEGRKIPDENVRKSRITWKGAEVAVDTPHQSAHTIRARVTLDPSRSPREMDWVREVGPEKGKTQHAIFEFLSEDEYRICFAPGDSPRPREFHTRPGTGEFQHVWKRVKD